MLETHQECLKLLETFRWQGKPTCPYCRSTRSAAIKKEQRYHCNNCFTSYSVTVNTLFHKTRVDLTKWFYAIKRVTDTATSISIRGLAKEIKVSKNTAEYMITRIHKAKYQNDPLFMTLVKFLENTTIYISDERDK